MIDSYTLFGGAIIAFVPIGYFYRKPLQEKLIEIVSYGTDMYIELKWKYTNRVTPIKIEKNLCEVTNNNQQYQGYIYKNVEYLTKGAIPAVESIDSLLCEGEAISNIIFAGNQISDEQKKEVKSLISKLAGPLCDFHENIPTLEDINCLTNGITSSLDSIIVNTEYFKEFILK